MNDYTTEYTITAVVAVVVILLLLGLIALGWCSRMRRQQDLVAPHPVPDAVLHQEPQAAAEGMYVSTVRGRDWLDRVAAQGLGIRTDARLEAHAAGVAVFRHGAENLFIPSADLTDVRLEAGINGKFVERGGILVLSWMLGDQEVSTGFRTRHAADRDPLLAALRRLQEGSVQTGPEGTTHTSPAGTTQTSPAGTTPASTTEESAS